MRRILCTMVCLWILAVPAQAASNAKYAAITFDDGPSGAYTLRLLEGLRQREVKATFLLCGYRLKDFPGIAEKIIADGHEIGCHGYSHKNMQAMSRREIAREITDTQALLPPDTQLRFLRPPGGCCSESVRQVAEAKRLGILQWSVDPRDWEVKDALAVSQTVLSQVHDGDVILLHDMYDSSVDAALDIIDKLTARGFRFVTVSQLAALRETPVRPGKIYHSFPAKE